MPSSVVAKSVLERIEDASVASQAALELIDNAIYTSGSGTPSAGVLILCNDGTNPRALLSDASGRAMVVGSVADGQPVDGNPLSIAGVDGAGNVQTALMDTDGHLQLDVLSSALPAGAATAALQTTGNASLASILAKILTAPATQAAQDRADGIKWITGTITNENGTTELTLQLGSGVEQWFLYTARMDRTGGTAANYRVRIGNAAGWTLGDPQTERYDSGSTAVGTPLQATFVQPVAVDTDANGRAYLEFGWDVGADNDARYAFGFRKGSVQA